MTARRTNPPLLISLPHGPALSGITTWAIRLAGELARRSHPVALMVHPGNGGSGSGSRPIEAPAGVEVIAVAEAATPDQPDSLEAYRETIQRLSSPTGSPCLLSPNLTPECYALGSLLAAELPEQVRLVGWMHSAIEIDRRILSHFAPAITRFIPVSAACEAMLSEHLGKRRRDIRRIPYGVPIAESPAERTPLAGRPLRLITTGRIEHEQKRSEALLAMSDLLNAAGLDHELLFVGDGAMSAHVDQATMTNPRIRRISRRPDGLPLTEFDIAARLATADIFILASKYEGLSIAMLEAMGRGCIPIVSDVSGARDAIIPGVCGDIVQCPSGHDEPAIARVMADAVLRLSRTNLGHLSRNAWQRARDHFSLASMGERVSEMLHEAAAVPALPAGASPVLWRGEAVPGSPTVPADAPQRADAALRSLAGRRIALWGAGRHTLAIEPSLRAAPALIVGVIDDDASRRGERIAHLPIIGPDDAPPLGATDVLISSAMHEDALWQRRSELERLGLRVHRMYAAA